MADYTLKLTPELRNLATEGGLDTSVVVVSDNSVSLQRTGYVEVYNNDDRKIVQVNDGETFNDTMQGLDDLPFIV